MFINLIFISFVSNSFETFSERQVVLFNGGFLSLNHIVLDSATFVKNTFMNTAWMTLCTGVWGYTLVPDDSREKMYRTFHRHRDRDPILCWSRSLSRFRSRSKPVWINHNSCCDSVYGTDSMLDTFFARYIIVSDSLVVELVKISGTKSGLVIKSWFILAVATDSSINKNFFRVEYPLTF